MIRLSVAIIARNEANNIERCLKSVKDADEIVVVDTGSEDNTVEIAKKYTDKVFTDYKWNDSFAEARNYAIDKCTGDWIMTIDCDCELITPISVIKNEIKKTRENSINVKCYNETKANSHFLPLVYKNDPSVRWKGAAHNHLTADTSIPDEEIAISYWWSDSHKKDPDRTLRILKKEIEKNPELIREKFYLAREYLYRADYITALYWYNKYVPGSTYGAEEAEAYFQMAKCHWYLQEGNLARGFCLQAIGLNTNFKEAVEFMAEMSGPKNKQRWLEFAEDADNTNVIFVRDRVEYGKDYYDKVFKERPDMSRYEEIHKEIGHIVGNKSVLDIGCGTADLSKTVHVYQGFDFSTEAIKIASENKDAVVWEGNCYDKDNFKEADYYVATEVMEHIDDLAMIKNIPSGQKFIFSVPSFADPAHLRVFTEKTVMERYKDLLAIDRITRFNLKNGKWEKGENTRDFILLVESTKK